LRVDSQKNHAGILAENSFLFFTAKVNVFVLQTQKVPSLRLESYSSCQTLGFNSTTLNSQRSI